MPKRRLSLAAAVLAGCALLPAPASADPLQLGSTKDGDRSLPLAATGKPFTASTNGTCTNGTCIVEFGKKANKIRTITAINCGMSSTSGQMAFGSVRIDDEQRVFVPVLSRAVGNGTEVAIAAWAEPVTVPAGARLQILLTSFGDAGAGICNIQGFIE